MNRTITLLIALMLAFGDGFVTFNIMPGGTPMKGDELKQVLLKNLNDIVAATALK